VIHKFDSSHTLTYMCKLRAIKCWNVGSTCLPISNRLNS
jgi:hypothetical protein